MKQITTLLLLLASAEVFGQGKDKYSLYLEVQPELTFYQTDYTPGSIANRSSSSFNIGFSGGLQHKLADRLYISLGVGYISRKLNTNVEVDQNKLPPPYTDSNLLLHITKSVTYSMFQFPIGVEYNFIVHGKTSVFGTLEFTPNLLLNTKYETYNYPSFIKNHWLGISINPGLGFDYEVTSKMRLTSSLRYSIINTVRNDEYTYQQVTLTHHYLQFSSGIKLQLQK